MQITDLNNKDDKNWSDWSGETIFRTRELHQFRVT